MASSVIVKLLANGTSGPKPAWAATWPTHEHWLLDAIVIDSLARAATGVIRHNTPAIAADRDREAPAGPEAGPLIHRLLADLELDGQPAGAQWTTRAPLVLWSHLCAAWTIAGFRLANADLLTALPVAANPESARQIFSQPRLLACWIQAVGTRGLDVAASNPEWANVARADHRRASGKYKTTVDVVTAWLEGHSIHDSWHAHAAVASAAGQEEAAGCLALDHTGIELARTMVSGHPSKAVRLAVANVLAETDERWYRATCRALVGVLDFKRKTLGAGDGEAYFSAIGEGPPASFDAACQLIPAVVLAALAAGNAPGSGSGQRTVRLFEPTTRSRPFGELTPNSLTAAMADRANQHVIEALAWRPGLRAAELQHIRSSLPTTHNALITARIELARWAEEQQ